MKKILALLTAALVIGLSGCGENPETATPPVTEPPALSSAPAVTAKPDPAPTPTAAPVTPPETERPAPTVTPTPAATPKPTQSVSTRPPVPTPTPEPPAEPSPEPTPSLEVRLDDETVLAAYREAAEVFGWFAGYREPELDIADQITILAEERGGEVTLYRVTSPGLNSMDELRAYLKTLFSDEIVDALLKNGSAMFADGPEGGLYTSGSGRGSDITKGGVVLSVLWPSEGNDALCAVQAEVELLDWPEGAAEPVVTGTQLYEFPYQKVGDKWVFTQFVSIF